MAEKPGVAVMCTFFCSFVARSLPNSVFQTSSFISEWLTGGGGRWHIAPMRSFVFNVDIIHRCTCSLDVCSKSCGRGVTERRARARARAHTHRHARAHSKMQQFAQIEQQLFFEWQCVLYVLQLYKMRHACLLVYLVTSLNVSKLFLILG